MLTLTLIITIGVMAVPWDCVQIVLISLASAVVAEGTEHTPQLIYLFIE